MMDDLTKNEMLLIHAALAIAAKVTLSSKNLPKELWPEVSWFKALFFNMNKDGAALEFAHRLLRTSEDLGIDMSHQKQTLDKWAQRRDEYDADNETQSDMAKIDQLLRELGEKTED